MVYSNPAPERISDSTAQDVQEVARDLNGFIAQVFAWITAALVLSAFFASYSDRLEFDVPSFVSVNVLFFIIGGMLVLAFLISRKVSDMPEGVAMATLVGYAGLQGALFGLLYRTIYGASLAPAYLIVAALFGLLCIYGLSTGTDPTSMRNLLIGTAAAPVLAAAAKSMFGLQTIAACAACASSWLLLSLACYHGDALRDLPSSFDDDTKWHKAAAIGALQIYLDLVILVVIVIQARWMRDSLSRLIGKEPRN